MSRLRKFLWGLIALILFSTIAVGIVFKVVGAQLGHSMNSDRHNRLIPLIPYGWEESSYQWSEIIWQPDSEVKSPFGMVEKRVYRSFLHRKSETTQICANPPFGNSFNCLYINYSYEKERENQNGTYPHCIENFSFEIRDNSNLNPVFKQIDISQAIDSLQSWGYWDRYWDQFY